MIKLVTYLLSENKKQYHPFETIHKIVRLLLEKLFEQKQDFQIIFFSIANHFQLPKIVIPNYVL